MAVKVTTSPEQIRDFAKKCEERHSQIMGEIRRVKAHEDATTATWSGEARGAFDAFMERYYFQADKLNDKLLQMSENLLKTGSDYASQDQEFSSRVQAEVSSLDLPAL